MYWTICTSVVRIMFFIEMLILRGEGGCCWIIGSLDHWIIGSLVAPCKLIHVQYFVFVSG
jgi:hypothetical protein